MGSYREIEGNLITMAQEGDFDVIAHGVNCFCTMGAGIAPQMAKAFDCDTFPGESSKFRGSMSKLGNIDYQEKLLGKDGEPDRHVLTVVNAYTQYNYGPNHERGDAKPLSYAALRLCLKKINHKFRGKVVGLPKIGAGLAGGNWQLIKKIIKAELKDCDVTVVIYNG